MRLSTVTPINKIMKGLITHIGFLDLEKTDFKCPSCKKKYNDTEGKYLSKQYKEQGQVKNINCKCGKRFSLTFNYKSEYVSFL